MQVVNRKLDELVPYVGNSRTHSPAQVKQVEASLLEFGWCSTISTDGQAGILAGHCRVQAAVNLMKNPAAVIPNWPDKTVAPTIDLSHLSKTQQKAYIIADNKLAMNAGWNEDLLASEMEGLLDEGFDIGTIGFSEDELAALFGIVPSEGLTDPDDVPEPPVNPITVTGDVWVMGNHRLMCGDSTDPVAVDRLMTGGKPDMIFTDPPYGMDYEGGRGKKDFGRIKGDAESGGALMDLVRDALACGKLVTKKGAAWYVFFTWRTYSEFESALIDIELPPKCCIVWNKGHFGLGHADYRPQHEFAFYIQGGTWYGDRAQSDVWTVSREGHGTYVHPTQKPVELVVKALNNSSKAGDTVLDMFGGSGSTIMACQTTGRSARVMELDPKYIDVIVKRWQQFTGQEATLEGDGRTFNEMCEVRYAGGDWAKNAKGSYDDAVAAAHVKTRGKDAAD